MGPLGNIIKDSLLFELNIEPKPGLVCPGSNGVHKDMNYKLMLKSIVAIAEDWDEVYKTLTGKETFKELQKIGIKMEENMFKATDGVNTNKGYIYLSLLIIAAFKGTNNKSDMFEQATEYGKESLAELKGKGSNNVTHVVTHGAPLLGARGEASDWIITNEAIDLLKSGKGAEYVLVHIISRLNDTCVAAKGGVEALTNLKKEASIVVEEFTTSNYEKFCKIANKAHLSCGGSADILAIAKLVIMLYENKKMLKS